MTRRNWVVVGLLGVAIILAIGLYRHFGWAPAKQSGARLAIDFADPDALIRTSSLAKLPRDLLRVPLVRDVLTEEFVYYYDQHEDRLGLSGLLRRVAYEYKLDWSDRLVTGLLDEPATVAFWRDGKGALRHFAIVIRRNTLAKLAQEAATVALKDTQLTRPAQLRDGTSVFALKLNPRRTLLVIARGERAVVLSHPGMVLDAEGKLTGEGDSIIGKWLADDGALAASFAVEAAPAGGGHTLALGARALTLGYTPFVSSAKALRFDFNGTDWSSAMLIDPARLPKEGMGDKELWRGVPANAAACVSLPLDLDALRSVVNGAQNPPSAAATLAAIDGAAAACWYREASLYAPLFVARVSDPAQGGTVVKAISEWAIAVPSPSALSASKGAADATSAKNGRNDQDDEKRKGNGAGERASPSFTPAAVTRDGFVYFSPDKRLVDLALDTLARKFPHAGEQLAGDGATVGLITPRTLSDMAMREALSALAGPGDERLREATKMLLPARMKALAQHPPYQVVIDAAKPAQTQWRPLQWRSMANRPQAQLDLPFAVTGRQ